MHICICTCTLAPTHLLTHKLPTHPHPLHTHPHQHMHLNSITFKHKQTIKLEHAIIVPFSQRSLGQFHLIVSAIHYGGNQSAIFQQPCKMGRTSNFTNRLEEDIMPRLFGYTWRRIIAPGSHMIVLCI